MFSNGHMQDICDGDQVEINVNKMSINTLEERRNDRQWSTIILVDIDKQ